METHSNYQEESAEIIKAPEVILNCLMEMNAGNILATRLGVITDTPNEPQAWLGVG